MSISLEGKEKEKEVRPLPASKCQALVTGARQIKHADGSA